VPCATRS